MKIEKRNTETYKITEAPNLDPVTVYVEDFSPGQGSLTIVCFGQAWTAYWAAMGDETLRQFVLNSDNDYLLNKMLDTVKETDFDEINTLARQRGCMIHVESDIELATQHVEMIRCFGHDWCMELPMRHTTEYSYLDRILSVVKGAFAQEEEQS